MRIKYLKSARNGEKEDEEALDLAIYWILADILQFFRDRQLFQ